MSEDLAVDLSCNKSHVYHTKCLDEWISNGNIDCAVCRMAITDENLKENWNSNSVCASFMVAVFVKLVTDNSKIEWDKKFDSERDGTL